MSKMSVADCTEPLAVSIHQILKRLGAVNWVCEFTQQVNSTQGVLQLFGMFNPLRAVPICIISQNEMPWLYAQTATSLSATVGLDVNRVQLIVLAENCSANPTLKAFCESKKIALVQTQLPSNEVFEKLSTTLPVLFAVKDSLHGVFLAVMNVGVLITGASGVGKSEVAMDLVQRGHQLIADDAVEIYKDDRNRLLGQCPEMLKGYIEIRGLGIINISKMFGPASVLNQYQMQLVINLKDASNSEIKKLDRLSPSLENWEMLGVQVPCLTMLVAPGRNLSVLVEAAVRDHLLRMSGIDSAAKFIEMHTNLVSD